jgi:hypothetical protein
VIEELACKLEKLPLQKAAGECERLPRGAQY